MSVICFVIHKQYTSNTHSQYTNIEAVAVKSGRLFALTFIEIDDIINKLKIKGVKYECFDNEL